jgi:glycerol-3-phosphate acyltransferase PlsY
MPIAVWALKGGRVMGVVTMIVAAIVIIRHIENIRRLAAGTESRFKA